jgi:hypothetical protein
MGDDTAGILWDYRAQSSGGTSQVGFAKPIQPQQTEGQAVVYGVLRFSVRNSEERSVERAALEHAANVIAGKRMFEVGAGADGFKSFVGKLRGQSGFEASAEFFARQLA